MQDVIYICTICARSDGGLAHRHCEQSYKKDASQGLILVHESTELLGCHWPFNNL
jgi:hypothetical protein